MTTLRLERRGHGDLDRALAVVRALTLVRIGDVVFAEVVAPESDALVRALAYAGVRAVPVDVLPGPDASLVRAAGRSLGPLGGVVAYDRVHLRTLTLAEATALALARRWPWRAVGPGPRERCRSLLRGADACLAWRRRAWARPGVLRARVARRALRPLVFERDDGATDERTTYASAGAIASWAFT